MDAITYFSVLGTLVGLQACWVQKAPWDAALGVLRVSTLLWAVGVPVLKYMSQ